eukprot:11199353-Lingulodinium_polyedra.AAC.1
MIEPSSHSTAPVPDHYVRLLLASSDDVLTAATLAAQSPTAARSATADPYSKLSPSEALDIAVADGFTPAAVASAAVSP